MYLSRLFLNPRSRQVQRELSDPYEMHRTLARAFPKGVFHVNRLEEEAAGLLFRVEIHPMTNIPTVLVQSLLPPDWSFLKDRGKNYFLDAPELPLEVENPATKEFNLVLRPGQTLTFRLRANPTIKKDREGKKQGRRVGLYKEEEQLAWLQRKIEASGGSLVSARVSNDANVNGKLFTEKVTDRRMRFLAVQFDGIIRVIQPELLEKTVRAGVGSGKGLGFGLLTLAPARG